MFDRHCKNHQFTRHAIDRIADIDTVDGVQYTIGACGVCGTFLIETLVTASSHTAVFAVDSLIIEGALQQYDNATRSAYLSDWYGQKISLPELVQKYQIFQVGDVVYIDSWDELVGGSATISGIKDGMLTFVDLPGLEYSSKELFEHQAVLRAHFGEQKAHYQ
jgi:hypothetical protein